MDVEKPAVRILVSGEVAPEMFNCIIWGLEEEGIPASWEKVVEDTTVIALAKRAASESRLHVGIGIGGGLREAVLHHRDLPDEKPLLIAAVGPEAQEELVRLGKNAARLVKGNPLCLANGNITSDCELGIDLLCSPEAVEQIASGVVEALLKHLQERKGL
ncbi:MAG: glycerol dehydratase reactivase beta/small subunit family protein [Nanoarchaeota archaeon]|nr:glycerol dehydratase reactivase beta/small subunit family protein [Nanoarchaeota archaeon]